MQVMAVPLQAMLTTLAQSATTRVLLLVTAMIALVIAGGIVAVWVRRSYLDAGIGEAPLETLSLHQLRQMHAQGRLSDEEFQLLKDAAVRAHATPVAAERKSVPESDNLRAEPGCDLTGEPLPGMPEADENQGSENQSGENHDGPDTETRPDA